MLSFKGFILLNSNQLRETVVGKISGDCSLNWNVLLPTRKNRFVLARVAPNNIFCPQLDHKVEPAQTPPESAEKGKGYREREKSQPPMECECLLLLGSHWKAQYKQHMFTQTQETKTVLVVLLLKKHIHLSLYCHVSTWKSHSYVCRSLS